MKYFIKITAIIFLFIGFVSCSSDDNPTPQIDTDGDGIYDNVEDSNGTDKNNPCDPTQNVGYTAYDVSNLIWANADCDNDSILNGQEATNGTDPYANVDTDGDGVSDDVEDANGTDKNNPCDPEQSVGYIGYDASNTVWANANCDADNITNGQEVTNGTDPYFDNTPISELLANLSDMNLFLGELENLTPNTNVQLYDLQTELFTDYAHKARFLYIPDGESMVYNGEGFPTYPNNTILAKTFYYFNDETNQSLGKTIIETRVLIKKAGIWEIGNYIWNDAQTEAVRDELGATKSVTWINETGTTQTINYAIPDYASCVKCHQLNGERVPIGPKIRNLNTPGQLQYFIDLGILTNAPAVSDIVKLPVWTDAVNYNIKQRSRAYLDVNCAHCHQTGGFMNVNFFDDFQFRYELSFGDSHIYNYKDNIGGRMDLEPSQTYSMPQIGTTLKHEEGYAMIQAYVDGL